MIPFRTGQVRLFGTQIHQPDHRPGRRRESDRHRPARRSRRCCASGTSLRRYQADDFTIRNNADIISARLERVATR